MDNNPVPTESQPVESLLFLEKCAGYQSVPVNIRVKTILSGWELPGLFWIVWIPTEGSSREKPSQDKLSRIVRMLFYVSGVISGCSMPAPGMDGRAE